MLAVCQPATHGGSRPSRLLSAGSIMRLPARLLASGPTSRSSLRQIPSRRHSRRLISAYQRPNQQPDEDDQVSTCTWGAPYGLLPSPHPAADWAAERPKSVACCASCWESGAKSSLKLDLMPADGLAAA